MARVVVPEPPRRTPQPMLSKAALEREPAAVGRSAAGTRLPGPPMVQPAQFAAIRRAHSIEPASARTADAGARPLRPSPPAGRRVRAAAATTVPGPSGTGINPWWRYQEQTVPGGDRLMVNVGSGNLLVQSDDVTVPHKGVALAFRRTYNSQSEHDVYGSDGAQPSLYGNGWTNTLDAHIVKNADASVSVYDIDGARYDYAQSPSGGYLPPPGQHATLAFDGACGLLWTKKSGTVYQFYRATMSAAGCGSPDSAYAGRLYRIVGRNQNTMVTLTYWGDDGFAGAGGKISRIAAATESGLTLTLAFADFNGYRLLQSLTRPDGVQITYGYGSYLNLRTATLPSNTAAGTPVVRAYGYGSWPGGNPAGVMNWLASPRWSGSSGTDGAYLQIGSTFSGSDNAHSSLSEIDHIGFVDPTPLDGTNTPLQPAPASGTGNAGAPFSAEYYGLGTLGTVSTPTYRDSDGHYTNWVIDATGRPTQMQECAATQNQQCAGTLLIAGEQWDADDNLVAQVEPRGFAPGADPTAYETDYAYDAAGNTVAVGEPPVTVQTANGPQSIRPTRLFSYDRTNNVQAYCDQVWSQAHARDWDISGNPGSSDSLCPMTVGSASSPGPVVYQYRYPSYEPYGELASATSELGYTRTYTYDSGGTVDYGLPLSEQGTAFAQLDASAFRESKTFAYDGNGNLTSYGSGNGTWSLAYDTLGRMTAATDPDNVTTRTCYYPAGTVRSKQTALQYALDGTACGSSSVAYGYDADGNATSETHHYANAAGTTTQWYDGADRLVEVMQPHDASDVLGYAWMTRYVYDLSQAGTQSGAAYDQRHDRHGVRQPRQNDGIPATRRRPGKRRTSPRRRSGSTCAGMPSTHWTARPRHTKLLSDRRPRSPISTTPEASSAS